MTSFYELIQGGFSQRNSKMVQVQSCEVALHFEFETANGIDGIDESTYRKSCESVQYRDIMG